MRTRPRGGGVCIMKKVKMKPPRPLVPLLGQLYASISLKLIWTLFTLAFIIIFIISYLVMHFAVPFVSFTATVIAERNYVSKGPKCEVNVKTSNGEAALIFYKGICIGTYKPGDAVAFDARVLRVTGFIDVDLNSVKVLSRPKD